MMSMILAEKIRFFPSSPGVYIMKNAAGKVLYVGKAKNLKNRVSSYFKKGSEERHQIPALMRNAKDIEYVVTSNEKEALLLEQTLINKHLPRYNIILKDDKRYLRVKINITHAWPGLSYTRKVLKDGALYFGPFSSSRACRETVDMVARYFKVRTCTDREFSNRSRPCMEYQLERCLAPCVGYPSLEEYKKALSETITILRGRKRSLLRDLRGLMKDASERYEYENAARLRDLMSDIEQTIEPQHVVMDEDDSYDVIGGFSDGEHVAISILVVREGLLLNQYTTRFEIAERSIEEIAEGFLLQYYQQGRDFPECVVTPWKISDIDDISDLFSEIAGHKVAIKKPRGEKLQGLVKMAEKNAEAKLREEVLSKGMRRDALVLLQKKLGMDHVPEAIECLDISNIQGKYAVGSLVCFVKGMPEKSRYRIYNIQGLNEPNDYEMMNEVLSRRFGNKKHKRPELLLIDGGRGQLQIAERVVQEQGAGSVALASIAKGKEGEEDKIYLPGRKNPVNLRSGDPALLLLKRIRDEAHRFGINRYRKRHEKGMLGV